MVIAVEVMVVLVEVVVVEVVVVVVVGVVIEIYCGGESGTGNGEGSSVGRGGCGGW